MIEIIHQKSFKRILGLTFVFFHNFHFETFSLVVCHLLSSSNARENNLRKQKFLVPSKSEMRISSSWSWSMSKVKRGMTNRNCFFLCRLLKCEFSGSVLSSIFFSGFNFCSECRFNFRFVTSVHAISFVSDHSEHAAPDFVIFFCYASFMQSSFAVSCSKTPENSHHKMLLWLRHVALDWNGDTKCRAKNWSFLISHNTESLFVCHSPWAMKSNHRRHRHSCRLIWSFLRAIPQKQQKIASVSWKKKWLVN